MKEPKAKERMMDALGATGGIFPLSDKGYKASVEDSSLLKTDVEQQKKLKLMMNVSHIASVVFGAIGGIAGAIGTPLAIASVAVLIAGGIALPALTVPVALVATAIAVTALALSYLFLGVAKNASVEVQQRYEETRFVNVDSKESMIADFKAGGSVMEARLRNFPPEMREILTDFKEGYDKFDRIAEKSNEIESLATKKSDLITTIDESREMLAQKYELLIDLLEVLEDEHDVEDFIELVTQASDGDLSYEESSVPLSGEDLAEEVKSYSHPSRPDLSIERLINDINDLNQKIGESENELKTISERNLEVVSDPEIDVIKGAIQNDSGLLLQVLRSEQPSPAIDECIALLTRIERGTSLEIITLENLPDHVKSLPVKGYPEFTVESLVRDINESTREMRSEIDNKKAGLYSKFLRAFDEKGYELYLANYKEKTRNNPELRAEAPMLKKDQYIASIHAVMRASVLFENIGILDEIVKDPYKQLGS